MDLPRHLSANPSAIKQGDGRNDFLFRALKDHAPTCETDAELQFFADRLNDTFAEPLSAREVKTVVRSVWRYQTEGRILVKGCEATVFVPRSINEAFDPYELKLYTCLHIEHGAKHGAPFVLAQQAAAKFGMSTKRMRKAQDGLEEKGSLYIVQRGEHGKRHKTVVRLI